MAGLELKAAIIAQIANMAARITADAEQMYLKIIVKLPYEISISSSSTQSPTVITHHHD